MPAPELAALVHRLSPGARLIRTRRLRGGLSARMHVLDIERADGTRWKVTLRRSVTKHRFSTPEHVAHQLEILRLLDRADVPAPRPILLDAEGEFFGVPAIVLSYLPGRPIFPATNLGRWTEGIARGILTVHAVTPDRFDLSWLGVFLHDGMRERNVRTRGDFAADPLTAEIQEVLEANLDRIDFSAPTLVHDDFWAGNTVWYRGRLAGIVDWTTGELGDPRADVSECRIDFVISHGLEVADQFRDDYERLSGRPLQHLWYFDLFRGVKALLQYEQWLEGYHDFGLHHLRAEDVGARLRAFLRRALADAATLSS
jgi:aminoglycoside phosphotransferase (APT) family kinase protein